MTEINRTNVPEFSLAAGIRIQSDQLKNWATKLNEACLSALLLEVFKQNSKLSDVCDGNDVWRGVDIDAFILNWNGSKV